MLFSPLRQWWVFACVMLAISQHHAAVSALPAPRAPVCLSDSVRAEHYRLAVARLAITRGDSGSTVVWIRDEERCKRAYWVVVQQYLHTFQYLGKSVLLYEVNPSRRGKYVLVWLSDPSSLAAEVAACWYDDNWAQQGFCNGV